MEQSKKKSKAEIMAERLENTALRTAALEQEGYHTKNATISILKANIMAFVTALPFSLLFIVLFLLKMKGTHLLDELSDSWIFLAVAVILSIPVHEGLHGLGWVLFCKEKGRSIQFGFMWESLTPYCHCKEPLSVGQYFVGLLLPFLVLGVLICVIALLTGNAALLLLGAYNIFIAGGDTTIGCIIAKYLGKDVRILDHPSECGAVAFVR